MTRLRAPFLAAVMAAIAAVPFGARAQSTPMRTPSLETTLNQYAAGDFDAAVAALPPPEDLDQFASSLTAAAPGWIGAGSPDGALHRRVVAASVALEAVQRALAGHPTESARLAAEHLIEWGAELLPSTSPPERAWYLASIALADRMLDHTFLAGLPPGMNSSRAVLERRSHGKAIAYIPTLAKRLPDEPRVRLALASLDDLVAPADVYGWLSAGRDLSDSFMHAHADLFGRVLRSLADVAGVESIRAEAHLRAGTIEWRFGRADAALAQLAQVEPWTREPYLIYLARFLQGKALDLAGRSADAVAAYRSALAVVPKAESSSTALATFLFLRDQRAEAITVVEDSLSAQSTTADPWRLYVYGDYRLAPTSMQALREALR